MSDAITLDVLSSSPVQLDVGDADPIAREEIAELAERVEAIEADYVTAEDVMGALGGEAPALVSGSSRATLGDPETASWMERTTAADGAALVESVKGNTLRWNQLLPVVSLSQFPDFNMTNTAVSEGVLSGTVNGNYASFFKSNISYQSGHRYLQMANVSYTSGALFAIRFFYNTTDIAHSEYTGTGSYQHVSVMHTFQQGGSSSGERVAIQVLSNANGNVISIKNWQLFDLTQMFGSGNEPATVAEFEALCPLPYYPYDPGSLLPVRMEGVETVAADESWSSQLAIPAATYFPDGMRSAGSVYDELRADAAVTRVGERSYQSGDESDASVITDGTVTHYALATPTVTPIDPPLPLSYRVGAGGTERVMVASGTTSAPPIFVTRYPLDPADLAASIAPVDGPTAKTNHQVGDLLMLGFTLCKATQVIVTGETIAIGTNVTRTSVAAEIAALS